MSKENLDMKGLKVARNEYLEKKFGKSGLEGERRQAVYFLYKADNGKINPVFEVMAKSTLNRYTKEKQ